MTATHTPPSAPESVVLRFLRVLARGSRSLILLPIAAFIISFVVIRWHMTYSAEAELRPEGASQGANRLGSIAAQFGVVLPNAPVGDPLRFQARLFETRAVLAPVVTADYAVATATGSADSVRGSFLDILQVTGPTDEARTLRGIDALKKRIDVQTDATTGLITFRVTTRWPELSLAIAQQMITVLEAVNNAQQQTAAEAEARFAAGRLAHERAVLDTAENSLATFLSQNRQYQSSPALVLEYSRLQRHIELAQAVVTSLAQAYEQSRIDAARDTPVLGVVDRPEGSVREAARPIRDSVIWAIVTFGAVLLLLLCRDAVRQASEHRQGEMHGILTELRDAFALKRRQ